MVLAERLADERVRAAQQLMARPIEGLAEAEGLLVARVEQFVQVLAVRAGQDLGSMEDLGWANAERAAALCRLGSCAGGGHGPAKATSPAHAAPVESVGRCQWPAHGRLEAGFDEAVQVLGPEIEPFAEVHDRDQPFFAQAPDRRDRDAQVLGCLVDAEELGAVHGPYVGWLSYWPGCGPLVPVGAVRSAIWRTSSPMRNTTIRSSKDTRAPISETRYRSGTNTIPS